MIRERASVLRYAYIACLVDYFRMSMESSEELYESV
jgi:hypothetical protein